MRRREFIKNAAVGLTALAVLEMILAVYESHRLNAPVEFPLKNRSHPLSML